MTDHNRRSDDGRIELILGHVEDMKKAIDGVVECLNGNGKPGIKIRLDRVERRNRVVDWIVGTFAVVFIGLVATEIYQRFVHPGMAQRVEALENGR